MGRVGRDTGRSRRIQDRFPPDGARLPARPATQETLMIRFAPALMLVALLAAAPAQAQSFSDAQRGEIERIIKDYLIAHPEVLQEAIGELEKRQAMAEAE